MNITLLCMSNETGLSYNVTTLAGDIQYETDLSGQAGKLTFSLQQDPLNELHISCGSKIGFRIDDVGIFVGYVFNISTDNSGIYKITSFDQMRYLKNNEVYTCSGETADQIFRRICEDTNLKYEIVTPSSFIIPDVFHESKTLYSIIEHGMRRANIAEQKQYFIKDKFGVLQFTELQKEKTNYLIGEASMLTDYKYDISIDKDTYNWVKVVRDNEESGKVDSWIEFNSDNQKRWGKLQHVQKADKELNEAEIKKLADNLLKLKNRETKTMQLEALGIKELTAGNGFKFKLDKLGIYQDMWITKATHKYENDYHTMSLEVFI